MPRPRPRRAPRPTGPEDDPTERARLMHELRALTGAIDWTLACQHEMWRRVRQAGPPNGPWVAVPGLAAAISHQRIAAGVTPPPGLDADMYPEGWGRGRE